MPRQIPIQAGLKNIRSTVDEWIRQGRLGQTHEPSELHRLNSAIYSDVRAALIQKCRSVRSAAGSKVDCFTVQMLAQVVSTDGQGPSQSIKRAYLDVAKDLDR